MSPTNRRTVEAILAAIDAHEGPAEDGGYPCSNETIVEHTDLDSAQVAATLEELWEVGEIEGILTIGGVKPHLLGIRRVIRGRPRIWGADGYSKEQL